MNRTFLGYYDRELQHLRGMAGEFAKEFPKIAGRLSLDQFECADPYVERLLEGFAFLAARVQYKYDAEFPRFTQSILSTVYPHYLAPTPSMMIAQFQPNLTEQGLVEGQTVPRATVLRSVLGKGERTACEYRTAHDVTLWPLKITQVDYFIRELSTLEIPAALGARAGLRIRLEVGPGMTFSQLKLDRLVFYIRGLDELPIRIYEQVLGHGRGALLQPAEKPVPWRHQVDGRMIQRVGFNDEQALLPFGARSFQGYRLLQEYFAFPQRYLFFEVGGLQEGVRRHKGSQMDLVVLLDQAVPELENRLDLSHLALFCAPAVNIFPKRLDRIQLSDKFSEHHVIPDRTRSTDFEVYQITDVTGIGERPDDEQTFRPFYSSTDFDADSGAGAYYQVNRLPRVWSEQEKERGRRSSYVDSEVFISLVDGKAAPYRADLRQLAIAALCTNRDLPLTIPIGRGRTDFTMEAVASVESIRCLAGPTAPRSAPMEGDVAWRAISHLCLNYLSLVESTGGQGTAALRDMLKLYADTHDANVRKQVDGVMGVTSRSVSRRIVTDGPLAFVRGAEVEIMLDENAFQGTGAFLLGAVLECFFAKYVSINSFAETVVKTQTRGEIMRWPARLGLRHMM